MTCRKSLFHFFEAMQREYQSEMKVEIFAMTKRALHFVYLVSKKKKFQLLENYFNTVNASCNEYTLEITKLKPALTVRMKQNLQLRLLKALL